MSLPPPFITTTVLFGLSAFAVAICCSTDGWIKPPISSAPDVV